MLIYDPGARVRITYGLLKSATGTIRRCGGSRFSSRYLVCLHGGTVHIENGTRIREENHRLVPASQPDAEPPADTEPVTYEAEDRVCLASGGLFGGLTGTIECASTEDYYIRLDAQDLSVPDGTPVWIPEHHLSPAGADGYRGAYDPDDMWRICVNGRDYWLHKRDRIWVM